MKRKRRRNDLDNVPADLRKPEQWLLWRVVRDQKVPKQVNDRNASTANPKTWISFSRAREIYERDGSKFNGIGFVFTEDDAFFGIDFDDCRNPETSEITKEVLYWIEKFNTYSEISPSGKGVHLFGIGRLPDGVGKKTEGFEIYDRARYFTITGNHLKGTPTEIQECPAALLSEFIKLIDEMNEKTVSTEQIESKKIKKGQRHKTLLSIAGSLRNLGADEEAIFAFIWPYNLKHCEPPRSKADCHTIARDAAKMAVGYKKQETSSILAEFNERYCVCMIGGKGIIVGETYNEALKRKVIEFSLPKDLDILYANRRVMHEDKYKPVWRVWYNHPDRRTAYKFGFDPNNTDPRMYNLYQGFGVIAREGNCNLMLRHIKEIICAGNQEHYLYLLAWMADAVQNLEPKKRPEVAVVIQGIEGTGKGVFAREFGSLFGSHFVHATHESHLVSKFNQHLMYCIMLFADEAIYAGGKRDESVLKGVISEPTMLIEPKYMNPFTVPNYINMIIASNAEWIIRAGPEARRYFVLRVSAERREDHAYFARLVNQMNAGGREALLYYLQNYEYSSHRLRTPPKTEALLKQKIHSLQPIDTFWLDRLMAGQVKQSGTTDWPESVNSEDLHKYYAESAGLTGERWRASQTAFGMRLKELCPGIGKRRITEKVLGKRKQVYHYFLPRLEQCRMDFEKVIGHEINWSKTKRRRK